MIRTAAVVLLTLTCSLLPACAQQTDRASLVALVPPPRQTLMRSLSLTCGLGYSAPLGYGFVWEGRKYEGEIARLQQQTLDASLPQRAVLYRQIGDLRMAEGERAKAEAAYKTSASLSADQRTREPRKGHDGRFLAEYALILQQAGETGPAETQARTAVHLAPRSWQVWTASGQIRMFHAQALTAAEHSKSTSRNLSAAAQAAWEEARHDFDTAVRLAPRLPEPYERRAQFRMAESFAVHPSMRSNVAGLPDFERAIALRPRDPYALAALAWSEYSDYGMRYYPNQSYDNFSIWKVLPPANRKRVLGLRHRIERLAAASNPPSLRARAYTALAWLEYEFHDVPAAQPQKHLQQALQLQPNLDEAAQFLMHTYGIEGEWSSLAHFSTERAQIHPDARHHLIAAYALYKQNQPEQAETQTQAALKIAPEDPAANLFLTFLLLHSNVPEKMQAAGACLDVADAALTTSGGSAADIQSAQAESAVLRGFYLALLGKQEEARQQFTKVLESDKDNSAARQGLALLPSGSSIPP